MNKIGYFNSDMEKNLKMKKIDNHRDNTTNSMAEKDQFLKYHFPWLSAATLRYAEMLLLKTTALVPPILDLGCGDGAFTAFTFQRRLTFGLDITMNPSPYYSSSYRMVTRANMLYMPFKESSIGTIVSNSVMEHVEHLDDALEEINRALKPGGEFIFTVPSAHAMKMSFIARLPILRSMGEGWLHWYNRRLHIVNFLKPSEWEERLEKRGFNSIEKRSYVNKTTMFWHTLFASAVLMGMQLFPRVRIRDKETASAGTAKKNGIAFWIGRLWFSLLESGYTIPIDDFAEGGYFYIRCRKRK